MKFIRRWHAEQLGEKEGKVYLESYSVRQIIETCLWGKFHNAFKLYLADGVYFATPLADAREIIEASAVDRKTWVKNRFDCDDFALVLSAHFAEAAYANGERRAAHCFGRVWGMLPGPHAINWMINDDKILRFIEPQTDEIFLPRETDRDIWFMVG